MNQKGCDCMKKLLCVFNVLLLLCLFSASASALYFEPSSNEYNPSLAPSLGPVGGNSSVSDAAPSWTNIANTAVTFVINPNTGNASVLFTVAAKNNTNTGITVKSHLERKSLGLVWKTVDIGQKNNEWVDPTSDKYISKSHSVRLSQYGQYRVVIKIYCGGDVITKTAEFKYEKGYIPGDADGNGKLTAADARKILRFSAKLERFTSSQRELCDLNADGNITASDARLVLRMSAGLL